MTSNAKKLCIRTATGIAFVVVIVACILWKSTTFTLLFTAVTGLCVREFCLIMKEQKSIQLNTTVCVISGMYFFLAMSGFCSGKMSSAIFIPYLLSIVYLLVSELYLRSPNTLNNWAYSMLSQMYISFPLATLNALAFQQTGNYGGITYNFILPLSVFIFIWSNDTGAYCFGTLLGKHKLFARISPNKTWEGSIGGALLAAIASQITAPFEPSLSRSAWLGLALTVVVFGTWGDLVESLMKRQLGLKDSGNILPGHGGWLDRFDSSILAIPASVIYLYIISTF